MRYRDYDSASGEALLTLRTRIGLTQAELANRLEISRRALVFWEMGNSYPKMEHLKRLIALGIQQDAFHHVVEEVRALWKVTRQKALLDEHWLRALLTEKSPTYDQQMAAWYAYLEQSRAQF